MLLWPCISFAQCPTTNNGCNLVINGDFEIMTRPDGECFTLNQSSNYLDYGASEVCNWFDAHDGTSDYYHSCNNGNSRGLINNSNGSQYSYPAGDAYAYQLPENSKSAELVIRHLVTGQELRRLPLKLTDTEITVQGSELASGMYIYTLVADGQHIETKKMVLLK